jgi:hypothetical protein
MKRTHSLDPRKLRELEKEWDALLRKYPPRVPPSRPKTYIPFPILGMERRIDAPSSLSLQGTQHLASRKPEAPTLDFPVLPMHKSNYIPVTSLEMLKLLGKKP